MPSTETKPIDWDFIVDTILNERCVLFLGSELFLQPDGTSLHQAMVRFLEAGKNPDILSFYEQDNFFLFSDATAKTKTLYKIKRFFNQPFPHVEPVLEKIARLPFHLIITVTPDNLLAATFEKLQLNYKKAFYWKNQNPENPENPLSAPKKSAPLIYNLFGNIEYEESLVLTHDDLFDYLKSLFGAWKLPEVLQLALSEAHNYIFLGVPFDKWYMQLLLRMLYLSDQKYNFTRYAASQSLSVEAKSLCIDQFRIEFVSKDILQFIDELYNRLESQGALRQTGSRPEGVSKKATDLVMKNKLEEAITVSIAYLENVGDPAQSLKQDLRLLASQLSGLMQEIGQGTVKTEDQDVRMNTLRKTLLNHIDAIKKFE